MWLKVWLSWQNHTATKATPLTTPKFVHIQIACACYDKYVGGPTWTGPTWTGPTGSAPEVVVIASTVLTGEPSSDISLALSAQLYLESSLSRVYEP